MWNWNPFRRINNTPATTVINQIVHDPTVIDYLRQYDTRHESFLRHKVHNLEVVMGELVYQMEQAGLRPVVSQKVLDHGEPREVQSVVDVRQENLYLYTIPKSEGGGTGTVK